MIRITDKAFVYTPSFETDLAKKFRVIFEQQRKAKQKRPSIVHSGKSTVVPIICSIRTGSRSA